MPKSYLLRISMPAAARTAIGRRAGGIPLPAWVRDQVIPRIADRSVHEMPYPNIPNKDRVSFRIRMTEHDAEVIDAARGSLPRSVFVGDAAVRIAHMPRGK